MLRLAVAMALLTVLSACQSAPPVQEMSDARQAIAVARKAGAAEHAPAELGEAERYLVQAENHLSIRSYSMARRDAVQAKGKALEALALSEHPDLNRPR